MLAPITRFRSFFRRAALGVAIGLCALAGSVNATVTIEFFFEDGNLANGSIAILVADANGNGFLPTTDPSFPGTILATGEFVGGSDDIILAVLQPDEAPHWKGSVGIANTLERFNYADFGISPGTPLVLYHFPDITQPGEVVILGDEVISYRNSGAGGSGGDIAFEAPADSGVYTLSALTAVTGGGFDPGNPGPGEDYVRANSGVPGSSGSGAGDDHGNSRAEATDVPPEQALPGTLSPGDIDFFSVTIQGLSKVVARTTGTTDTVGQLLGPDFKLVNDSVADDDNGAGTNFGFEVIVDAIGTLNLAVQGKNNNQAGDYEVVFEVIPLPSSRPDAAIGKTLNSQRGDDLYNSSGAGQKLKQISKKRRKLKFFFEVQNDAGLAEIISVKGTPKNRYFNAVYLKISGGRVNVTAALRQAAYQTTLEPFQKESFQLMVKPSRRAKRHRRIFLVDARSPSDLLDRVKAEVKAK